MFWYSEEHQPDESCGLAHNMYLTQSTQVHTRKYEKITNILVLM